MIKIMMMITMLMLMVMTVMMLMLRMSECRRYPLFLCFPACMVTFIIAISFSAIVLQNI